MILVNLIFCSGRDLLNISPSLALNKSLTMEEGKEYTILVTADLGENMTKTFLWTDLGRNNYSQLPYKIAEVGLVLVFSHSICIILVQH